MSTSDETVGNGNLVVTSSSMVVIADASLISVAFSAMMDVLAVVKIELDDGVGVGLDVVAPSSSCDSEDSCISAWK